MTMIVRATAIPRRVIRPLLQLAGALVLSAGTSQAAAQSWQDEGTLALSIQGRPAGTERFSIRRVGGATGEVVAFGEVELRLSSGMVELAPRLRTAGPQGSPVAYEVAVGADTLRGRIAGERFSATTRSGRGERYREYVASAGAAILDENVAHHHWFVIQRTRNGSVPVIVPRENRQVIATVSGGGVETVEVGGQSLRAERFSIQPQGGPERHVWIDAEGRLLRVDIPAQGYSAVRTAAPR